MTISTPAEIRDYLIELKLCTPAEWSALERITGGVDYLTAGKALYYCTSELFVGDPFPTIDHMAPLSAVFARLV